MKSGAFPKVSLSAVRHSLDSFLNGSSPLFYWSTHDFMRGISKSLANDLYLLDWPATLHIPFLSEKSNKNNVSCNWPPWRNVGPRIPTPSSLCRQSSLLNCLVYQSNTTPRGPSCLMVLTQRSSGGQKSKPNSLINNARFSGSNTKLHNSLNLRWHCASSLRVTLYLPTLFDLQRLLAAGHFSKDDVNGDTSSKVFDSDLANLLQNGIFAIGSWRRGGEDECNQAETRTFHGPAGWGTKNLKYFFSHPRGSTGKLFIPWE